LVDEFQDTNRLLVAEVAGWKRHLYVCCGWRWPIYLWF
jgi:hypothetical protein